MGTKVKKSYFILELKNVLSADEDILVEICFRYGASGISEALQFQQESLRYEPETVITSTHDLNIYFSESPAHELLLEIAQKFPKIHAKVKSAESQDWLEEWKKGFEPFCLAADLWIVPSWCAPPPGVHCTLLLDPGMAFGTGTHATTQLVAKLMSSIDLKNKSFLDVGTGTGILAMAAARWGARQIEATEIDPEARKVARENISLNKISNIEVHDISLEEIKNSFDLLTANIIDGVLLDLRSDLMEHVHSGGDLCLSGILSEREEDFRREFQWGERGFSLINRQEKEEWVAFHLRKK